MLTIGIIFISTGAYNCFWDDFHESIQKYFCPESKKNYHVFTDDLSLTDKKLSKNVFVHYIEDKGWMANILQRSELFISIQEELLQNDYIFNLNSNYRPTNLIKEIEIIPTSNNDWLCGLCFDFYRNRDKNTFAYERNPKSKAYIPYGNGKYYFQGGFYGGRTSEFLEMSKWIKQQTEDDISAHVIPIYHDESYLNCYFINRNPLILGTKYAKAEEWERSKDEDIKGILLDKIKILGNNAIFNMKKLYSEPSLNFLIDNKYQTHPIGVINLRGGVGNQMFQYALFLSLGKKFKNRSFFINMETLYEAEHHQGYQLDYIFNVPVCYLLNNDIRNKINLVPEIFKRNIIEKNFSIIENFKDSTHPIWIIDGYWQNEEYFSKDIREHFKFDFSKLNRYNQKLLSRIAMTDKSVAVHVRRGDYVNNIKTYNLMGGICTKRYYYHAFEQFEKSSVFFVFSDDIEWCRENLKYPNIIYVTKKKSKNDWQDMALMASCKHQIISNSSFSWWSAWLNENINKKIITPPYWYNGNDNKIIIPGSWHTIKLPKINNKYSDLTITIPVRIDSKERYRNLHIILEQLLKLSGIKIILLEADLKSRVGYLPDEIRKVFVEDSNLIFHRTKYINMLSMLVDTKYLGVWDTDVIVISDNIRQALNLLRKNKADMVYPYDGRFYNIPNNTLNEYIQNRNEEIFVKNKDMENSLLIKHSCGGAFIVNKQAYLDAGGENEKFTGWGPEDLERYKRWEILGCRIIRLSGGIYHMRHPRKENSRYYNNESKNRMLKVLLDTCKK